MHYRCCWKRLQMEKIFKLKYFNNLVWTPLGSWVDIYINFCLQVHFKVSAAWYCSHYFPPVSTTPAINLPPVSLISMAICHRRRWHRRQICCPYRWHRWQHKRNWWQNLPPVSWHLWQICHRCRLYGWQFCLRSRWHRWCTLKKFEITLILFSGAWGKVLHGKNLK